MKNDVLIVASGCAAQVATKAGFFQKDAKWLCGDGMRRVCDLLDIPPILHMGACIDNSRILRLVSFIAEQWGVNNCDLPIVGCAPEWMSEKAVSIANYFMASGVDVYLGIHPQIHGSEVMMEYLQRKQKDLLGGIGGVLIMEEGDPMKLTKNILDGIEAKRKALGI